MRKNKAMSNYLKESYNQHNIEIISIDEYECKFKCTCCGAIKEMGLGAMRSHLKTNSTFHSESCSRYFNEIIKDELGEKHLRQFIRFFRSAKDRCCNPNNKDYYRYKGKFKFKDYPEYVNHCLELYKESLKMYGDDNLSIDRVVNSKGYEVGNVRFVPMTLNLLNRDNICPVMAVNIVDKTIIECESLNQLANEYFEGKITSIHQAIQENRLYLNTWKIFYTIKTASTIERDL